MSFTTASLILRGAPSKLRRLTPARHFRTMVPQMGRRSAKIAGRKGTQDSRKAKLWGKIAKQVLQAAKAGGASVESNQRLKEVLYQAKQLAVPKDIIDRNLKKATEKDQADFSEILYEAYGPGASGFLIECLTDNANRTANFVRNAIQKCGGKISERGSVLFNFSHRGQIIVSGSASEDQVFEAAMHAGADDIETRANTGMEPAFRVLTAAGEFASVRESLREQGLPVVEDSCGLVYVPFEDKTLDGGTLEDCEDLLARLLDLDDVDAVYTNCAGLSF